ncbi:PP2C family protein-serine/threonine phosphatase [Streptomyces antimicrobicus]|uniref:Serine/threonine-protein phosphatase n=1 Tax=Streptomyces antimicrobicus TaxID=2883108 RepID=A0ABS8BCI4_9ACTN|nr:PP2C family protein-serine/threonine phosphatase [Streptomyces antimicrobicus]MCB5182361.1 serine/threonine-protein phosphatase [Streptomyces antimicrobicus]
MTETRAVPRVRRACVLAWGGAAVTWELSSPGPLLPSLASCAAFLLLATGCALRTRQRLARELRRSRQVAGAVQRALLRPLPARMDGLALAAVHGPVLGGDLYEALPTPYGVRIVIGDVRGHGLPALGAATAVLGCFREAAHDEPTLAGVLRRLERALRRAARDPEDFVTVLLLEITADSAVTALNCGHPWPYLLPAPAAAPSARAARRPPAGPPAPAGALLVARRRTHDRAPEASGVRVLAGEATLPPLGVVPLPEELDPQVSARLAPGEGLLLHTDGVEDARDRHGGCFPLERVLARAAAGPAATPARLVAGVYAALLRHAGGQPADDVALLVLRNDRPRPSGDASLPVAPDGAWNT